MARHNQLSRYGAISRTLEGLAPSAKVFLVGDSDDTTYGIQNLAADFPPDVDGVVRVYSTIQDAVNAAAAGRGDVVLVAPGYDHTLGRTDSWTTAGVRVVGLGAGNARPTLRYTSKTDEVGLGANNVSVENIRFLAAADSIARALDLDSGFSGQSVKNCVFDFNATTNDFRVMLRLGSRRALIEGCRFLAEDTAGSGRGISLLGGDPDFAVIRNNFFYGQYDTLGDSSDGAAPIAQDTTDTSDTNLSGILIEGNEIVQTDTAASSLLRFSAGYTVRGLANENRFVSYDSGTADTSKILGSAATTGKGLRFTHNYIGMDSTEKLIGDSFVAAA